MLIVAQNLGKVFVQGKLETKVLSGINFTFSSESSYALTGVSGSGKSTLMHILSGLDFPTSGKIIFDGLQSKPNFGVVFQEDFLIDHLTVFENIALAGIAKEMPSAEIVTRTKMLLEKTQLLEKQHAYPVELSGGQRTRVAICRALVTNPDFFFADEPTGNLDAENAQRVIELILDLQQQFKIGVIVCTHDQKVFSRMQHILKLSNGNLETLEF